MSYNGRVRPMYYNVTLRIQQENKQWKIIKYDTFPVLILATDWIKKLIDNYAADSIYNTRFTLTLIKG